MKKNKKIIAMLLAAVLCIGFSATSIQAGNTKNNFNIRSLGKCTIEQGQFDSCNNG